MRIAFTSDLHTDHHAANRLVWQAMIVLLQDLAPDVFICCGAMAAEEKQFGMTLMALEQVLCPKLLVPGKHDVWIQNPARIRRGITSQQKYYRLLPALCRAADVHQHDAISPGGPGGLFWCFSPVPLAVAVGMPVTQHPPHRPRRAARPHRAPQWDALPQSWLPHTSRGSSGRLACVRRSDRSGTRFL